MTCAASTLEQQRCALHQCYSRHSIPPVKRLLNGLSYMPVTFAPACRQACLCRHLWRPSGLITAAASRGGLW